MSAQITAYISIMCAAGVLNTFLCVYAFLKRHTYSNIVNYFIVYAATTTIYCFSAAIGLLASDIGEMKLWTTVEYIGIGFSPAFGLIFVLKYFDVHISKTILTTILLIPTITFLMVATNDLHHLHYRVFEMDPLLGAPFVYQEEGIWYMVHGTFSFSYMFMAGVLICLRWKEINKVYRPQLITLFIGQIVPITATFLYLIDVAPRGVDPVPMTLWITSALYLWSVKTSRLFTMMPIAKDTIFHNMNDGVLVLDDSKRLLEYNKAFQNMFPQLNQSMLGTDFISLWASLTNETFHYSFEQLPITSELSMGHDEDNHIYQIRISPLKNSKGYLIIFTDITELKEMQQQLERQAYYDELTQIYNRRAFFQHCEHNYFDATKEPSPFTVLLLDIDHFKKVNDTYGHHIGDEVLVHFVNTCKTRLPAGALFARYGGEEFVVVLNGYSQSEGLALATDLCRYIEPQYYETEHGSLNITISVGVAQALHETAETLHQLLNKADQALYAAKKAGRNCAVSYEAVNVPLSN